MAATLRLHRPFEHPMVVVTAPLLALGGAFAIAMSAGGGFGTEFEDNGFRLALGAVQLLAAWALVAAYRRPALAAFAVTVGATAFALFFWWTLIAIPVALFCVAWAYEALWRETRPVRGAAATAWMMASLLPAGIALGAAVPFAGWLALDAVA